MISVRLEAQPQIGGKNKVQYHDFNWSFIQSEHFDIYFYKGSTELAQFAADVAESSYISIRNDFRYDIQKRVPIIIYKSHNDWQQTNVVLEYLEEGIGGVTEAFKNRVIVPYEGSYEMFRHVIHHELVHAVMNDMIYGGSIQSAISGSVRLQIPLWVAEGLAEYESLTWDTNTDMWMRDATIHGYLPTLEQIDGYGAYRAGQSIWYYIANKYGNEKIGEILSKMKSRGSVEAGIKQSVGLEIKDFSEQWQKAMRKEYWPDVKDRQDPEDFSKALTDHVKDRNFYNTSPAISPNGDMVAFITDRNFYFDIYLMSATDGKIIKKLISGQKSESFEELHILTPGISWSPDSRKICFAAKSGAHDAIYIVDVKTQKTEQFELDLDGVFSTAWSPRKDEIAFSGNRDGQSDIYVFNIKSHQLRKITDDIFSDHDPSWSWDGNYITFTSDRKDYLKPQDQNFRMLSNDFHHLDLYRIQADGSGLKRITSGNAYDKKSPIFSPDGKFIYFTSDQNGVFNIYKKNLETGEEKPLTDILTGCFQISISQDGTKMVYVSFFKGGYDIYLIKNPHKIESKKLSDSVFFTNLKLSKSSATQDKEKPVATPANSNKGLEAYRNYVFNDPYKVGVGEETTPLGLSTENFKNEKGDYRIHKYKIKFAPDLVYGAAGYNTFWGLQGTTQVAISDIMGDHRMFFSTNLFADLRNSNFDVFYMYLPKRIDYGLGAYHHVNFFLSNAGLIRYLNYGAQFLMSRPFTKFTRLDFSLNSFNVDLEYLETSDPTKRVRALLPGISLSYDNSLWLNGLAAPLDGMRAEVSFVMSPRYTSDSREFKTVSIDIRKYWKIGKIYSLGWRIASGASDSDHGQSQQFFLGGVDNWLNRSFKGGIRVRDIGDVYFSKFITPLRGFAYYQQVGNKFFLSNMEFRFPLIQRLTLGWPLPLDFPLIMGNIFWDVGSAWTNNKTWKGVSRDPITGTTKFQDLLMAYGIGARINLGFILLRIDTAWTYDLDNSSVPHYYFSLGYDF